MTALPMRDRLDRGARRMRERYRAALRDLERARDTLFIAESALAQEREAVARAERRLAELSWKLGIIRNEQNRERREAEETAA